jgi:tetratricopeptide (TPR) repeat protein
VYDTVYRCLQPGRSRMDVELVVDVVRALADNQAAARWRQAYQAITGTAADAAVVNVSDRLPDGRPDFTGRAAELRRLCRLAASPDPVVVVIDGMAGVGKTSLAVQAAHRMAAPAVVFAVDLRGHDPARPPADPGAVLDACLKSLGLRGCKVAGLDLPTRTARFRELLLGRKTLLLLDNAASADQVLPLLPRTPGSFVLVTSRARLDLPTAETLSLEPLSASESVQLLQRQLGPDQDPEAIRQIADHAGHLPLALALVAGRIISSPEWTLADHLDRLADRRRSLRLDDQVEVALAQSYNGLGADHRCLLRRLALHPGDDWDAAAAAALTGGSIAEASKGLQELADRSLIQLRSAGRYGLHGLVRMFAAQRARDDEPARLRRDASTALLDHYRRTAAAAMALYAPHEAAWRPLVAESAAGFADREAARRWLDVERVNLIASGLYAAEHGWPEQVADLSGILYRYLDDTGQYTDGENLHHAAVQVATGTPRGRALSSLGVAYWRLGSFGKARNVYQEALGIAATAGDRPEEIRALINLGLVNERSGDYRDALAGYWASIEISDEIGSPLATAHALQNVVHLDERLGRYQDALDHSDQCLRILAEVGDRSTEGRVRNGRGLAQLGMGDADAALTDASGALEIAREVDNRVGEAYALITVGGALRKKDDLEGARKSHETALSIAREMGNQDCEAQALNDLGATLLELGDADDAVRLHKAAMVIAEELGDPYERARSHDGLAAALLASGETQAARGELGLALALYGELRTPEAVEVAKRSAALGNN